VPIVIAIIPTFVLVGPLALLATLFPALFGGLAFFLRRWLVMLSIASLESTLYVVHAWFGGYLSGSWWGSAQGLWVLLAAVALGGVFWSWKRRTSDTAEAGVEVPRLRPVEQVLLGTVSLVGVVIVFLCLRRGTLMQPPWRDLLVLWAVAWVGVLAVLVCGARTVGRAAPGSPPLLEGILLSSLALACASIGVATKPRTSQDTVRVLWVFEPAERGAIISSPVVDGNRVYVAALHGTGLSTSGAVYCLDADTGKELWRFDDQGEMQPVFCTPCAADGRLFIGEGLHENQGCKFYCLDSATGQKLWQFETSSHTESNPCVAKGGVYFGAGDDGIYCRDAATGSPVWHFNQPFHVDAGPVVRDGRLYVGSGVSRAYATMAILCLDANTGKVIWSRSTNLPAWGSPALEGEQLFAGLGNGRLDRSAAPPDRPSGALLCLNATNGAVVWRTEIADAILDRPALDTERVYFGARDHCCYALERPSGRIVWSQDLGSPIVAAPALHVGRLYLAASEGRVCGLAAETGAIAWTFEVAAYAQAKARVYSSPSVVVRDGQRRIFVGAALENTLTSTAALYCLQD
jgi:outer membrane protein assembly factor BamB